jgi:two-component system chemotaxis response regulator CheB
VSEWASSVAAQPDEECHRAEELDGSREPVDPTRPSSPPGDLSAFTCPTCGGALWESEEGGAVRYQCRTGHAFSPRSLLDLQSDVLDDALWAAYRALLEKEDLARRMGRRMKEHGTSAIRYAAIADRAAAQAEIMRRSVLAMLPTPVGNDAD